jgi:F0F1-type ATP synthase membrane subunit b/b'
MDPQIIQDFLLKQLPVIVVLGFFCYFMYKYFTGVINTKDVLIREKDVEIKELNKQVAKLVIDNNEIMRDLKDIILKMLAK